MYDTYVFRSHRIQLDPTDKQLTYFAKASGVARLAYNWGLAEWKKQYAIGGKPSERSIRRYFNSIKDDKFPFVREVTKCASEAALKNLGYAFQNFFNSNAKYPSFKKKGRRDAFEIDNSHLKLDGYRIQVPKLGWVRMREQLRLSGKLISATISRTADHWFVSVTVELPDPIPPKHEGPAIGIDFGCINFATLSTGEVIEGPKPHKQMLSRLRRLNKSLHRKKLGSRNRNRARRKLAKLHAHIANIRCDFLHKFTTGICRNFSVIGIEDLNVFGMTKTTRARSVMDQAPYEMRRQLEYKSPMTGSVVKAADRFYPSSRLCNVCGVKNTGLKLSDREWTCTECGTVHDRDDNASQNLKNMAVGSTVTACGVGSSGAGPKRAKLPTAKQEPNASDSVGIAG